MSLHQLQHFWKIISITDWIEAAATAMLSSTLYSRNRDRPGHLQYYGCLVSEAEDSWHNFYGHLDRYS